jgi:hypothetical protein
MQYMLMLYLNEAGWPQLSKVEQRQGIAAYVAYAEALTKAGVLVSTGSLAPSTAATTLRLTDGKTQVLDGPYADTKEQIGGYFIIEAQDLDTALKWAARCPTVRHGVVEVRHLQEQPA